MSLVPVLSTWLMTASTGKATRAPTSNAQAVSHPARQRSEKGRTEDTDEGE